MITLESFPALNATLNALAAVLLGCGYGFIRAKRVAAHKACMLSATAVSAAFLTCYLYYHSQAGSTGFQGQGWIRTVYFTVLLSHTVLAAAIVPLVLTTLWFDLSGRLTRHRKLARWFGTPSTRSSTTGSFASSRA